MNDWMAEAARLSSLLAPRMTADHALELADDLYRACSDFCTPGEAVARFFAVMPKGWNASPAANGELTAVESEKPCKLPA